MCSYGGWPGSYTGARSDPARSISRSNSLRYMEQTCLMMEKRQLFLRSYQFSRKRSLPERIRRSFTKAKRVIWFKLRLAARYRKLVCSRLSRLRQRLCLRRRRSGLLLIIPLGCSSSGYQIQSGQNSCPCLC
ncbi:hypothetical protein MLD38_016821 [Melastoma candidum]|uniref:Uncharacterized protein n=1 Tax=Melastoma candidum TaxID=119954 RepID=A0ACB9QNN9_9MYRT|nr:hypothetical protein MLD38_016821 [Melastoma candidum]